MTTIPASEEQRILDQVPKQLYIGGEWRDGAKGTLGVEDPSTGETLCEVADASAEDASAALGAAVAARPECATIAPRERGEILRRAFETITARADELALVMTLEMGKPLKESKAEIIYGAEFLRWFSEQAVRIDGRYAVAPNGQGTAADDEAAGGAVPAHHAVELPAGDGHPEGRARDRGRLHDGRQARPADATLDVDAGQDPGGVGPPEGVVNLVTASSSSETMAPLIADPRLRKLSFTGSTEVGRRLMEQASENLLRLSMELGGNAPFIVFDDADIDSPSGRPDRQDAQHRRGVHGGEPLPRLGLGRRARSPRSSPTRWAR